MIVYIAYYLLIGISSLSIVNRRTKDSISSKSGLRIRNIWFALLFLGLFAIMGLRHPSMGVDLDYKGQLGYLGRFQFIANSSWSYLLKNDILSYEKGFVFYNKIIGYISDEQQWFLIVNSFLSLLPIFIIYNKYSENLPYSIIIYLSLSCYSAVFSAIRQSIAIGICFISFIFVKNKKIIPFVLLVLLAFTFHSSAIFTLLMYPAYWIKIKKKWRIGTLFGIVAIFIFRVPLFSLLSRIIKDNAVIDNNGAINLFLFFVLVYIFSFFFGSDDEDTNGLLNLFLIAIICQLFGNLHLYAARLGYYFMPFLGLLIPKVLKNFRINEHKIISFFIASIFVLYGLYVLYNGRNSWTCSYPWIPFWK